MRTIRTILCAALIAGAGNAVAEPPPPAADFHQPAAVRGDVERDTATSDADDAMRPVDLIHFAFDSTSLDRADRAQLEPIVEWLATHPGARIRVEGHADQTGDAEYNIALSRDRAEAVRIALASMGAPSNRIDIAVYGEAWPVSDLAWINRRVRVWGIE